MDIAAHFEEVRAAADLLSGVAHRTPVHHSRTLDRQVGAELFFKCENFQRCGAFKFRGAMNALARLGPEERRRGVLTFSSGNHAQGIALAGALLGIPTTIVMPGDAPASKRAATVAYGGRVLDYDIRETTREAYAQALLAEHDYTLIPPFDHPHIIAGQGTAALELIEDCGPLDLLLTPCGGGGLLSGTAIAAKHLLQDCRVIGVEPEQADDAARSFRTKTLQTVHNPETIADGTRTPSLGRLTFPLILELVDDLITVSEREIIEAVRYLFFRLKLVVEPSGALPLAAVLAGKLEVRGRVGLILSGGNVDASTLARILAEPERP
jgi:threonine dehydratase